MHILPFLCGQYLFIIFLIYFLYYSYIFYIVFINLSIYCIGNYYCLHYYHHYCYHYYDYSCYFIIILFLLLIVCTIAVIITIIIFIVLIIYANFLPVLLIHVTFRPIIFHYYLSHYFLIKWMFNTCTDLIFQVYASSRCLSFTEFFHFGVVFCNCSYIAWYLYHHLLLHGCCLFVSVGSTGC